MNKKLFIYITALSFIVLPVSAFAMSEATATKSVSNYSEEELVTLIAKLQKQLEEVRKNKVQCVLADIDLSIGDGEDDGLKDHVKSLQKFLKEKGYFAREATGYFGKLTRTALVNFQKDNGIDQTGELNTPVRAAVKNLKCRKDYFIKKTEANSEKKESVKDTGVVTSITLANEGSTVKWSTVGYSKNGFKVVWSKNPNPTYPTRDGDKYTYLSDPNAGTATLEAFSGTGTYFVRACEYLGGVCGMYSNEITLSL